MRMVGGLACEAPLTEVLARVGAPLMARTGVSEPLGAGVVAGVPLVVGALAGVRLIRGAAGPDGRESGVASGVKGRRIVKQLPLLSSLSTESWPWCILTNSWVMARPMPLPWLRMVSGTSDWKKRSKIFSRMSGAMPIPVSFTRIQRVVLSDTNSVVTAMLTAPLAGVNLKALERRLNRMRSILSWSKEVRSELLS